MSTYGRHEKLFFSWKDVSAEQNRVWLLGCRPIETPEPISSNRGSSDAIRGSKFFSRKKPHHSTSPEVLVQTQRLSQFWRISRISRLFPVLPSPSIKNQNQKSKIHPALRRSLTNVAFMENCDLGAGVSVTGACDTQ